jgi:transposase
MASLQVKMHKGRKYWCIVESKRINGKPRSFVVEYLGTADSLLARLTNEGGQHKVKSFSHGALAALLPIAKKLGVIPIINKYTSSKRHYWPKQPLRNNLTAGITLLLAAIGRACRLTSKLGWYENWAKDTSCDHLLRISSAKLDSQHFWDLMDCIPEKAIEDIELEILQRVLEYYPIEGGTLLYDTTNFYTFINSTNDRCEIAQRGKYKQKRDDLRQVGFALAVTQKNHIPLLHHTYKGNISDCKIFSNIIFSIKKRMEKLKIDMSEHTIVFDRGCNSKDNLKTVKNLKLHYIGALTPSHHEKLILAAEGKYATVQVDDRKLEVYREKTEIWGEERTVLVFVSEKLKEGQLRGVYQSLRKKEKCLKELQKRLLNPRAKKRSRGSLEKVINKITSGQFMEGLIIYELTSLKEGHWTLNYRLDQGKLSDLEDRLGFRIVMTNRHDWASDKIIKSFYGQATVERAFKDIKNPQHLTFRPQFHWTDHKIKIHYFICILGYLLSTLLLNDAHNNGFVGSLNHLMDALNGIRLSRRVICSGKQGKPKVEDSLEEMSEEQKALMKIFHFSTMHLEPFKMEGIRSYH